MAASQVQDLITGTAIRTAGGRLAVGPYETMWLADV
jgi:hypothetical protein